MSTATVVYVMLSFDVHPQSRLFALAYYGPTTWGFASLRTQQKPRIPLVVPAISARRGSLFGLRMQPRHLHPSSYYHTFSTDIPATGISSFTITVTSGSVTTTYNNGGKGYPVEDNVIFLRDSSSISSSNVASISVAVCKPINDTKHHHC